ncbi:Cation/H(+) antiporter 19 [Forsythia ovata]|uniref:Cation/H(+) antiporter 19 n=1 Tax=Forsythia ovata TaxID=205694 RepID=A0ABD1QS90_9LAMI
MEVALFITAFSVLARILAELKLLTTRIGETAMAAVAFNDVAVAIGLTGNSGDEPNKSLLIFIWVLLSGVAFVAFMMATIKPVMNRLPGGVLRSTTRWTKKRIYV